MNFNFITISPAFRSSLPVTATSFINKVGDVGIRFLPMLLIERQIQIGNASLIMALVKGAAFVSVFAGGILGDRFGFKRAILTSFLLSALGMLALTNSHTEVLICAAGMLSACGQGIFAGPIRLLLTQSVPVGERKVALAWLRSGNNAAILTASFMAYITAGIGIVALFLFDAITSILAVVVGLRLLPDSKPASIEKMVHPSPENCVKPSEIFREKVPTSRWISFGMASLLSCLFTGGSELFFVGTAAQAKISFGNRGIEVFSQVYMLNTALCMLLTVPATKFLRKSFTAICLGFVLLTCALTLIYLQKYSMSAFFIASLLQTLGELCFASVATFLIMEILPPGGREGKIYSIALSLQMLGKVLGGGLAFYFMQGSSRWVAGVIGINAFAIAIALSLPFVIKKWQNTPIDSPT